MNNMTIEEEWLSQILGNSTRLGYNRALLYFKEFMDVDSTKSLVLIRKRERNFETRVVQFYQWLQKEKEVTSNSARAYCIAIQSLFSYLGLPLKLKHKLPKTHMKIESWKPSLEDLQKLYKFGDISVKAWISLSRDVPARISDLLKITPEQIESGEFLLLSKKESVVGKCYVSEDTKALFRQLNTAGIVLPTTQRGIDKMMSHACKVAGMARRLNQHLWRKIFISSAINMGISEMIWKCLTFKTIPVEQLTYFLNSNELRTYWEKIIKTLPLEAKANGDHAKFETDIELITKVVVKVIKELKGIDYCMPYQGLGLIEKPSDKEVLKRYLEET